MRSYKWLAENKRVLLVLFPLAVLMLWLAQVDFALACTLLISTLLSLAYRRRCDGLTLRKAVLAGLLLLLFVGTLLVVLSILVSCSTTTLVGRRADSWPVLEVTEYAAVAEPSSFDSQSFALEEWLVVRQAQTAVDDWYDPSEPIVVKEVSSGTHLTQVINGHTVVLSLPLTISPTVDYTLYASRTLNSKTAGFLTREVEFKPSTLDIKWSQGHSGQRLGYSRFDSAVVEIHLPKNSFLGASHKAETFDYANKDIVTWEASVFRNNSFVYIPAPFHHFRWFIRPFAGMASLSELGLILLSLALPPLLIFPAHILGDMSKEKATAFLKGIEHGGESVRLEELTAEVEEQRKIIDRLEKELEEYRHSRWWQFWR